MIVDEQVKNQRAIEALRNGVPNRDAVAVLGSNQKEIEDAFRQQLERTRNALTSGEGNIGMLVAGDFGTGKSHLLEYLKHLALEQNFVCSKVVISKETPLYDIAKLYRAAVEAAIVPGKRGSAMTEIATALRFETPAYADFRLWTQEAGLNARFPASLFLYERTREYSELNNYIIRFWSGDKMGAAELKKNLKEWRESVTYKIDKIAANELALQRFMFATRLIIAAGYSGWILLIDEVELIGRYSLLQRAKSYAELARWMGKLAESNVGGLTSVLAIIQAFQSIVLEGKNDLERAPNRLRARGTESDFFLASQVEKGMMAIQNEVKLLRMPDKNVLAQTYEKVRSIHAKAYDWEPPSVQLTEHMSSARMRQYVKGWITEWDLRRLDSSYIPKIEIEGLEPSYTEDKDLEIATEGCSDSDNLDLV